ncbi:hypothetical protein OG618_05240 [Kitasatospora sp. NBC_01246]|uniref:hypothetical protein n=1 Tax=Kitasatospora sp. NBC_01246 TaxID=2903570 RepID=UPI002E2F976E|nr:hypothetical protein [Kitasatospora sp. NBC_01246]
MSTPRPDSTPDSAPAPGAAADRTVPLAAGARSADRTVRLGPDPEATVRLDEPGADRTVTLGPKADAEATGRTRPDAEQPVRLDGTAADRTVAAGPDPEATVRLDETGAASATFLDPRVWGGAPAPGETATLVGTPTRGETATLPGAPEPGETGTPSYGTPSHGAPVSGVPAEQPLAPGELRRFGPGVPPQAAAVWHGAALPEAERPPRRRRVWRVLVPVLLLALLAFLFWRFTMPALAVTGVGASTDPAGPGCGGTAVITAAVETNGAAGTLRYRWLRSDGTTSGELAQEVGSGTHRTELVLRWSFEGQGSLPSTATLELLSPGPRSVSVSFPYHCP